MESPTNTATRSNLRKFCVFGLFGNRDVVLNLEREVTILMGENGLGKTTALNALYYTLSCNVAKLRDISFEKIRLDFWEGDSVEFTKRELFSDNNFGISVRKMREVWHSLEMHGKDEDIEYLSSFKHDFTNEEHETAHEVRVKEIVSGITDYIHVHPTVAFRALLAMAGTEGRGSRVSLILDKIKESVKEEILYLPTYRRIEEDLHNLANKNTGFTAHNKLLIQFGMEDVKATFNKVLEEIKTKAISGFSKITGDMLNQYVDGFDAPSPSALDKIKPEVLSIILARVGENISSTQKENIINLVSSEEIFKKGEEYKYLINFLSNLIVVYEEQSDIDNSIKTFAAVCNKYLYGKKFIYNESRVDLEVVQNKGGKPIELKNLSSGEKQIISLFTKIYFEIGSKIIVLFDEPELSLSIDWQRILLPDVVKSNKCSLLLAVTHSPFIFDNELDVMAEDMTKYVIER